MASRNPLPWAPSYQKLAGQRNAGSFQHVADGDGAVVTFGWRFRAGSRHMLLRLDYESRGTDAGLASIFFADGHTSTTRLNSANWESLTLSLGIELR